MEQGTGIPADALPHILERFYQVADSLTRKRAGTEIGLALVKELIELHGGRMMVSSVSGETSFI